MALDTLSVIFRLVVEDKRLHAIEGLLFERLYVVCCEACCLYLAIDEYYFARAKVDGAGRHKFAGADNYHGHYRLLRIDCYTKGTVVKRLQYFFGTVLCTFCKEQYGDTGCQGAFEVVYTLLAALTAGAVYDYGSVACDPSEDRDLQKLLFSQRSELAGYRHTNAGEIQE